MKYEFIILATFFLSACTAAAASQPKLPQETSNPTDQVADQSIDEVATSLPAVQLEDLGPAPELTNQVWLNVDQPLRLAELRGQVVLLEMWTFG